MFTFFPGIAFGFFTIIIEQVFNGVMSRIGVAEFSILLAPRPRAHRRVHEIRRGALRRRKNRRARRSNRRDDLYDRRRDSASQPLKISARSRTPRSPQCGTRHAHRKHFRNRFTPLRRRYPPSLPHLRHRRLPLGTRHRKEKSPAIPHRRLRLRNHIARDIQLSYTKLCGCRLFGALFLSSDSSY